MEKGKTYRSYNTITREQAMAQGFDGVPILKGWDASVARRYFTRYATLTAIDFCRPAHNEPQTRYIAAPGIAIYIKSTGGRWGKSSRVRIHAEDSLAYARSIQKQIQALKESICPTACPTS